jgi:hypothetical protein
MLQLLGIFTDEFYGRNSSESHSSENATTDIKMHPLRKSADMFVPSNGVKLVCNVFQ